MGYIKIRIFGIGENYVHDIFDFKDIRTPIYSSLFTLLTCFAYVCLCKLDETAKWDTVMIHTIDKSRFNLERDNMIGRKKKKN